MVTAKEVQREQEAIVAEILSMIGAALRGLVPAKRVRGRLVRICGQWFWK